MKSTPFFNAHNSPVGAFATFTFGHLGARGGLGMELGGPANQSLFIGFESRDSQNVYRLAPFYEASEAGAQDFEVEEHAQGPRNPFQYQAIAEGEISRDLQPNVDRWTFGELSVTLYAPTPALPRPDEPGFAEAILPVVTLEIEFDNRGCDRERTWVSGFGQYLPQALLRPIEGDLWRGVAHGQSLALATDSPGTWSGTWFTLDEIVDPTRGTNLDGMLGNCAAVAGSVPAGEVGKARLVMAFHRAETVTTGIAARYAYARHYPDLDSVIEAGFRQFEQRKALALDLSPKLVEGFSEDQAWMAAQAIRSYYGSTELLEAVEDGRLLWVVNEGEYRMMNTLDLQADMVFWELERNPWVVQNVLDQFADRYSYRDELQDGEDLRPGGISFAHDMGVMNQFSPPGRSSYERAGLTGCFSYMTAEQLVNWTCVAWMLSVTPGFEEWVQRRRPILLECLESLIRRDLDERTGTIQFDSSRCEGGEEITTYDSLDASLGAARGSTYLAGKTWAAYLGLEQMLSRCGETEKAAVAREQADRAVQTLLSSQLPDGTLPAVLDGRVDSKIIPVIEGLGFPLYADPDGDWRTRPGVPEWLQAMKHHLDLVLRPGVCLFEDGGWKLSSTSNNSWLSKIYLCQWIAREIFGRTDAQADRAHREWLERSGYFAWSDQMVSGEAKGSKYYPRGVTCALWHRRTGFVMPTPVGGGIMEG